MSTAPAAEVTVLPSAAGSASSVVSSTSFTDSTTASWVSHTLNNPGSWITLTPRVVVQATIYAASSAVFTFVLPFVQLKIGAGVIQPGPTIITGITYTAPFPDSSTSPDQLVAFGSAFKAATAPATGSVPDASITAVFDVPVGTVINPLLGVFILAPTGTPTLTGTTVMSVRL